MGKIYDEYIIDNYLKKSDSNIAIDIGRIYGVTVTKTTIFKRRRTLGLWRTRRQARTGAVAAKCRTRKIRISKTHYEIAYTRLPMKEPMYLVYMVSAPYYCAIHPALDESLNEIRRLLRGYNRNGWNWDRVRAARADYLMGEMSVRAIARKYRMGLNSTNHMLRNRLWIDEDYTPPPRRVFARNFGTIEIFPGEPPKTLFEWSRDERCKCHYNTIINRYSNGVRGAALLERASNKRALIEIFGERKGSYAWAKDPRSRTTGSVISRRWHKGMRGAELLEPTNCVKVRGAEPIVPADGAAGVGDEPASRPISDAPLADTENA